MNKKSICIRNARLVFPGQKIRSGDLLINDGCISATGKGLDVPAATEIIDAAGALLTPGLIDVHTHGVETNRYDAGSDELRAAAERLAHYGCTCVQPTILGRDDSAFLDLLSDLAGAIPEIDSVSIPGLHIEGPFMAYTGAGCSRIAGDVSLVKEMIAAANGLIRTMAISPDVENIVPVIEFLKEQGILAFITHTGADIADTQRAIDAGALHATHFYDVFYPQPEVDLGVRPVACTETILADRRATIDFICDGVHVDPIAIRMGLLCKGWENVSMITDSNIGAGLAPGEYDTPWGFGITVAPETAARILPPHEFAGALAGSALTMNQGIKNLLGWFAGEWPEEQLWALGTSNPARLLGLPNKGSLAIGADADLVLWNDDLTPRAVWLGGTALPC